MARKPCRTRIGVRLVAAMTVLACAISIACGDDSSLRGGSEEQQEQIESGIELEAGVTLSTSIPDFFPEDVVIFPAAEIRATIESGDTPKAFLVDLTTESSSADVWAFYEEMLKARGLDARGEYGGYGPETRLWVRSDLSVTVTVGAEDGHTVITVAAVEGRVEP